MALRTPAVAATAAAAADPRSPRAGRGTGSGPASHSSSHASPNHATTSVTAFQQARRDIQQQLLGQTHLSPAPLRLRESPAPIVPNLLVCCGIQMSTARRAISDSPERSETPLPRSLDNTFTPNAPSRLGDGNGNANGSANGNANGSPKPAFEGNGATGDNHDVESDGAPHLLHRVKHDNSILALAVSNSLGLIYAGTGGGEVLAWSIETYELVGTMNNHTGGVLALCLSEDEKLLFSSGGDAIVNVWDAVGFKILYSIYSTFDVGDVFCISYSSKSQTAYFGAQNTSIQWYDLKARDQSPKPTLKNHPSRRNHRFFDSTGPGGKTRPRTHEVASIQESRLLEIDPNNIVQYAHYSYVYCMQIVRGLSGGDEAETLLSGGGDGDVKLWNIDPKTSKISERHTLKGSDSGVLSLAVRETFLYCGLTDGEINIWDLDTYQMIRCVKSHCDDVLAMAVWGNNIFSGSSTGYTKRWNGRFECLARWEAHQGLVLSSVATTRRDRLIYITGGNDNCIAIWDVSPLNEGQSVVAKSQNDELLSSLGKLVSFRTVSNNPLYLEECRRGATYLKSLFKRFGASATLLPSEDNRNPVVFARFSGTNPKASKTILFYGHYDVIPAELQSNDEWVTDPFELTGVNGYLYGRGVSDNKGPCLAALFAAGELVQEQALTSDIVFLIEGEEESGSRGFANAVRRNKDLIGDVDWVLLANSYWLDDEVPCLTYGLRGVIHATIEITSEHPDLHSGVDGSRLNREPTIDLVGLLARLTDDDGTILIPGFYDPICPVTEAEEERYADIAANFLKRDPTIDTEALKNRLMSKWRFPSLTIHRVNVSGPSNATIIPRAVSAAISLRIVPDQQLSEVKEALTGYLQAQFGRFKSSNQLKISIDHEAEPWLGDPENEAFRTLEKAIMEEWGKDGDQAGVKPFYIREGGSIPTARFLEKEFGAMAAHLPCGQASDHAHLDNERLRLKNLYKSKAILKKVFTELPWK
ncbi:hypothetical protein DFH27DRAFT_315009 [Peziza echinospora]|nr:hypothetical protein DFH27DRAFT_315009 [Peziza echinospora]